MSILRRIWPGLVGAVVGAAMATLVQVIGQTAFGLSGDDLLWLLMGFALLGFIIGAAVGDRFLFKGDDML